MGNWNKSLLICLTSLHSRDYKHALAPPTLTTWILFVGAPCST